MLNLPKFYSSVYKLERLAGSSPGTTEQYEICVRQFDTIVGDLPIADIRETHIATVVSSLIDNGRSNATANKFLRHTLAILNYAREVGYRDRPIRFRKLPTYTKSARAWTVADITKLLDAVKLLQGTVGDIPAPVWWKALILTLYDTGARISAVMVLKASDVEMADRIIYLRAESAKDKADQLVRFSIQTRGAIEAMGPIRKRTKLFPWPYDSNPRARYRALSNHFSKLVTAAGLDCDNGLFHRIRRTRATYGECVSPGSATADLGHSSRWVTERHYLDPRIIPPIKPVVDQLPRP